MKISQLGQIAIRNRTPFLLALVAVFQVLDWHSTLSAPAGLTETNGMLVWLGGRIGFALAVSLVKIATIAAVAVWFLFWRKHKGAYEFEFTVCLSVVVLVYGSVIFNNYAQHA
ncbi:hypothetical protein DBB29_24675 [Pandoraea cepalis]|uniref:DUF5658 domain-containing protein n=1 Tax=Pandoraea cepalis TaxID=2508294 RepID=A0AAW7MGQ3_9BURK|nr:hypothetical protein [Pandoraea cepalis]MDN4571856.1 hypothetical protein [Pandoraea cepalis]MDN4581310.1 hypothetical protein [Pandoraea cepalis]